MAMSPSQKRPEMQQSVKELDGKKVIVYHYYDPMTSDFVFQVRIPRELFSDPIFNNNDWQKELSTYLDTLYEQVISYEPDYKTHPGWGG